MGTPRKKSLLIVDDERDIMELLSMHFEDTGEYEVASALDTLEAFSAARSRRFDLILTDFRMAKLTGQDLIELFRSQDSNATTPVVVFSAFADEARRACHGMENVYFVSKPAPLAELETFVRHIIAALPTSSSLAKSLNPHEFILVPLERTARAIYGIQEYEALVPGTATSPLQCDASATFTLSLGDHLLQVTLAFPRATLRGLTDHFFGEGSHSRPYDDTTALTEFSTLLFSQIRRSAQESGIPETISRRAYPVLTIGDRLSLIASPSDNPVFGAEIRTEYGSFHVFLDSN